MVFPRELTNPRGVSLSDGGRNDERERFTYFVEFVFDLSTSCRGWNPEVRIVVLIGRYRGRCVGSREGEEMMMMMKSWKRSREDRRGAKSPGYSSGYREHLLRMLFRVEWTTYCCRRKKYLRIDVSHLRFTSILLERECPTLNQISTIRGS